MMKSYRVPRLKILLPNQKPPDGADSAYRHIAEQIIKRSRFITSVGRASDRQSAKLFVDWIRTLYPDATHNCWAYNAGPPGDTGAIGQSDDGEPHGTAGKPILNQIIHYPGGEIVIVVTRYFGGVKLGGGGLVRAYQSSAALALLDLPLEQLIEKVYLRIYANFDVSGRIAGVFSAHGVTVLAEEYSEQACYEVAVNENDFFVLSSSLQQVGIPKSNIVIIST